MKTAFILTGILVGVFGEASQETDLNDLVLLSLSPVDGKAVVRLKPDAHDLHLVKVGDSIPQVSLVVRRVLPDRLVLEDMEPNDRGDRRTIWLFKGDGPEKRSRLKIFERFPPPEPELRKPRQKKKTSAKKDPNEPK